MNDASSTDGDGDDERFRLGDTRQAVCHSPPSAPRGVSLDMGKDAYDKHQRQNNDGKKANSGRQPTHFTFDDVRNVKAMSSLSGDGGSGGGSGEYSYQESMLAYRQQMIQNAVMQQQILQQRQMMHVLQQQQMQQMQQQKLAAAQIAAAQMAVQQQQQQQQQHQAAATARSGVHDTTNNNNGFAPRTARLPSSIDTCLLYTSPSPRDRG